MRTSSTRGRATDVQRATALAPYSTRSAHRTPRRVPPSHARVLFAYNSVSLTDVRFLSRLLSTTTYHAHNTNDVATSRISTAHRVYPSTMHARTLPIHEQVCSSAHQPRHTLPSHNRPHPTHTPRLTAAPTPRRLLTSNSANTSVPRASETSTRRITLCHLAAIASPYLPCPVLLYLNSSRCNADRRMLQRIPNPPTPPPSGTCAAYTPRPYGHSSLRPLSS